MDFRMGERFEPPPNTPSAPSWIYDALGEVRRVRVGDVPVAIEIIGGGGTTVGLLDGVDAGVKENPFGVISLERGSAVLGIPCEDIAAFTLLDPEPHLDRSDEVRG